MRHLIFVVLLCALAAGAGAQEATPHKDKGKTSGFGAPVVKCTVVHGQGALMIGGRGGWILNHSLVLGGGGYAITTEVEAPEGILPEAGSLDIEFGYGGFEVEYILHPDRQLHPTLYTLIGVGTARYVKDVGPVTESNDQAGASDLVFVLEPGVGAEANVTGWFRLGAGVSYRVVAGVGENGLENGDLSGFAGTLAFKFGRF